MPYIGKSPSAGVRQRYQYTATAGQTTFSGTDLGNLTLTYTDNNFVDVFQNGVLLKGGGTDYTATSGTSVVLATGASVSDVIEIIVYDVFSVGNFFNRTDSDSRYALNEGGVVFNETSADVDFRVESNGEENMLFVDGGNNRVGIGTTGGSGETLTVTKTGADATVRVNAVASQEAALKLQGNNTVTNTFKIASEEDDSGLTIQKWNGSSYVTHLKSDANGHITKPLQPAFSARKSSDQNNIGVNTTVTITFDTEVFDNNADFASNQFTAPVTGKYNLHLLFRFNDIDTSAVYYQTTITTSNRNYTMTLDPNYSSDVAYKTFAFSVLADMDANDTASCIVYQSGGTQQTDFNGNHDTMFMGHLVC